MRVNSALFMNFQNLSIIFPENAKLTDPTKIDQMLDLAEFVKKGKGYEV
jgi:hypothetical protein